jgi:hypothetical protein
MIGTASDSAKERCRRVVQNERVASTNVRVGAA